MPAGAAPGERRGGRQKGSVGRKRTEREIIAAKLKATAKSKLDEERAEIAAIAMQAVQRGGVTLAKDVLEEFMFIFRARAIRLQPGRGKRGTNEAKFKEYAALAVDAAARLAKYQSPTLRAIMVATDDGLGKRRADEDNVVSIPPGDDVSRATRVYRMMMDGEPVRKAG